MFKQFSAQNYKKENKNNYFSTKKFTDNALKFFKPYIIDSFHRFTIRFFWHSYMLKTIQYCKHQRTVRAEGVVGKRFFAFTVSGAANILSFSVPLPNLPLTKEPFELLIV